MAALGVGECLDSYSLLLAVGNLASRPFTAQVVCVGAECPPRAGRGVSVLLVFLFSLLMFLFLFLPPCCGYELLQRYIFCPVAYTGQIFPGLPGKAWNLPLETVGGLLDVCGQVENMLKKALGRYSWLLYEGRG